MRILKLGRKIVYTCPQCGSKLEIEEKDWIHDLVDYNHYVVYVKCPCCGNELLQNKVMNNINK